MTTRLDITIPCCPECGFQLAQNAGEWGWHCTNADTCDTEREWSPDDVADILRSQKRQRALGWV